MVAFVPITDTDGNEHYINFSAIVNVRTTMSGGTFVDVNGLESPIFVKQNAKQVVEMLLTGDHIDKSSFE